MLDLLKSKPKFKILVKLGIQIQIQNKFGILAQNWLEN
jgi:hypothetical protein